MNQPTTAPATVPAAGGDDYVDKGVAAGMKKYGGKYGNDPKAKAMSEKITDKLRGMFEKFSGKKVPAKISN